MKKLTGNRCGSIIPIFDRAILLKYISGLLKATRKRVQIFQGVVIKRKRGDMNATFTVRKISHGVGVEKTFALHSPRIEMIELVSKGRVRRSRLYYLRDRRGKAARIKERGII